MIFLALFIIPLLSFAVSFILFKTIDRIEVLVMLVVQAIIVGTTSLILYYSNVSDIEIWNGLVVSKNVERVSCSHSYQCNCRQVPTGKNTSTTVCSTCYEHSHDFNYAVCQLPTGLACRLVRSLLGNFQAGRHSGD